MCIVIKKTGHSRERGLSANLAGQQYVLESTDSNSKASNKTFCLTKHKGNMSARCLDQDTYARCV